MAKTFKKEVQKAVKLLHPGIMSTSKAMDSITKAANKQGLIVDWNTGKVFDSPTPELQSDNEIQRSMNYLRKTIKEYKK